LPSAQGGRWVRSRAFAAQGWARERGAHAGVRACRGVKGCEHDGHGHDAGVHEDGERVLPEQKVGLGVMAVVGHDGVLVGRLESSTSETTEVGCVTSSWYGTPWKHHRCL